MVFKKHGSNPNKQHKHTKTEKEQAMLWQTAARSINDIDTLKEDNTND